MNYWFGVESDDTNLFEELGIYGTGMLKDNKRLHVVLNALVKKGYFLVDAQHGTDKDHNPISIHFKFKENL